MKRTARFLTLLAMAASVFTGCRQEEADYELPGIKISGPFAVDNDTKKASYAASEDLTVLSLSVSATRDWTAEILWDSGETPWIAVTPDSGEASENPQTVKLTILDNPGYNRAKDIKFSINFDYKTLSITQTGAKGEEIVGTLDNPYTVAGVIKYVKNLGADVASPQGVYIKGIVSQVTEEFSSNYGNGTFYISDDGTTDSEQFYAFRVLYLGNRKWTARDEQVKVGDEVWIYGNVVNYKGNTPETVQNGAFVYAHNGNTEGGGGSGAGGEAKGAGTVDDPYNPAGASAAVSGLTWTSNDTYDKTGDVYVKGIISRIATNGTFTEGGTYGNASFYISEDGGTDGTQFYIYHALYFGKEKYTSGTDIQVGDEVIIYGPLMNYQGKTPETVGNEAYLYSLNGTTGGSDPGDNSGGDDQGGDQGGDTSGAIFSQAFKTAGQGQFTIENKTELPEGLSYIWSYDSKYGMKASGYASNTNFAAESWLISPVIDLGSATKPVLTFRHALNFFSSVDKAKEEATLWAKAEGGEWTQLSGIAYPESLSWTFIDSGEIDLSAYAGKKVQIAFKYVSTASKAGTWEVDDFAVAAK